MDGHWDLISYWNWDWFFDGNMLLNRNWVGAIDWIGHFDGHSYGPVNLFSEKTFKKLVSVLVKYLINLKMTYGVWFFHIVGLWNGNLDWVSYWSLNWDWVRSVNL